MYRMFNSKSELLKQTFLDGEIIVYCGKHCKVSLRRSGSLNKVKNSLELSPIKAITVSEETEVIDKL